jgi:glycosyltransferase involved in cell wall biosynthesis
MSDLLLTIGIPTYNRVDCLRENLENLLPAFYPFAAEVEVLISDNASTDTTTQIIHQAMETYPFVRTQRHQNNLGLDANFFSLIPAARGKFLWLLCDDDQIRVSEIPRLLNLLRFPGEIKTVFLNYALYDQHLKICEKKQGVPLEKDCQMAGPDLFRVLNDELLRASCLVVRKNEIDRTLWPETMVGAIGAPLSLWRPRASPQARAWL